MVALQREGGSHQDPKRTGTSSTPERQTPSPWQLKPCCWTPTSVPVHLCRTPLHSKRNSFFSAEFNGFPTPFYAQPERGLQTRAKMLCRDCCWPEHQRAGLTLLFVAAQPQWKSSTLGWSWYGPTMQMLWAPRNTPSSGTAGLASLGGCSDLQNLLPWSHALHRFWKWCFFPQISQMAKK